MKKIIFIIICSFFVLASCNEDQLTTYSGEKDNTSGIYFQRVGSYTYGTTNVTYADSTVYSFVGVKDTIKKATLKVTVRTFGNISDKDRPFVVKVVNDPIQTTAVEGTDFSIDYSKCIMPAGKSEGYVLVTLFRTAKLTKSSIRIKLKLEENEYFKFYISEYKESNVWNRKSRTIDALSYVLRFAEIYTMPSYWASFGNSFFGAWTPEKYSVVNNVAGWIPSDWSSAGMAGAKVAYGRFDYVARAVQTYLQQMADKGTPVKDGDGSNMQLPSPYSVIYQ